MDQLELIKRKAVQIISEEDLEKKLKSGKKGGNLGSVDFINSLYGIIIPSLANEGDVGVGEDFGAIK